ncbi:6-bladed beta-propeller [Parabacteroides sp. AM08-6]|uniref:6-bladed beta-propeller n=1 Tax=Parabacteroides sp. AM08-6 TaxID=2292053 RepID=UPI001314E460|nr:6-bladed beta-propeller [Parabacteroides sp. AM08-6]
MNRNIVLLFLIVLCGCTHRNQQTESVEEVVVARDTVIHLKDVLDLSEEVRLSEIADSITYIPLETKPDCLLGDNISFRFTDNFILTVPRLMFDWNGCFKGQIGKQGQGPGEDPSMYASLLESKEHYYTVGNKIIEYDRNGKYTGKEVSVYHLCSAQDSSRVYSLFRNVEEALAENSIVLYQYPDSLIWVNNDFKVHHVTRVVENGNIKVGGIFSNKTDNFFPRYKNKTLFYNFYNDTVFSVSSNGLSPEWIIDLGEYKLPNEITLYKLGPLMREAIHSSAMNSSELMTKTDGKIAVSNVYESDHYLFLFYYKNYYFAASRNLPPQKLQLAIYDKQTKKLTNVKEARLIDDFHNGPKFFPTYGAFEEKLISVKWPYELKDYVEEHRSSGKLSPRLIELADNLKNDDNPVLIVVHLKKKM